MKAAPLAALLTLTAFLPPLPAQPAGPPPPARWNVRVEARWVSLPTDKATNLLPALLDDAKIEEARRELVAMVGRREADLLGCPTLRAQEGQCATSETILEIIYPTELVPPSEP